MNLPQVLHLFRDPMMLHAELPLRSRFHPLGFPLDIETDHPCVLSAATESWSHFPLLFDESRLHLRLFVEPAGGGDLPPAPVYRGFRNIVSIVSDARNYAVCDSSHHFAYGWVTPAVVEHPAWFRWYFLEAMAYTLLTQLYLTPVHAACVARNGSGVLLCGASGAGKSTLAYACARRGWTLVSEDSALLVQRPEPPAPRVLGNPRTLHFRDSASLILPELNGRLAARRTNGKLTIEIPSAELAIDTAIQCIARSVVFLAREPGGEAALAPVTRRDAFERLLSEMPAYDETVVEQQARTIERLLEVPAFELRYSDFEGAVSRLEGVIANL